MVNSSGVPPDGHWESGIKYVITVSLPILVTTLFSAHIPLVHPARCPMLLGSCLLIRKSVGKTFAGTPGALSFSWFSLVAPGKRISLGHDICPKLLPNYYALYSKLLCIIFQIWGALQFKVLSLYPSVQNK
jgi:hypothetical protein